MQRAYAKRALEVHTNEGLHIHKFNMALIFNHSVYTSYM